ncbi:magnesium transporter [Sabulicella rubraurantiaca]|uniref:magnesium transporter n=1 Tax=Sabulicella rubraurantiaca TaxID=2811429 RepID=UPI001A967002|nr:magnesium transporter [Sabulicella rubraurantiaca]
MISATLPPSAAEALHPADLATLLEKRAPATAWETLTTLPLPRRAETFGYLSPACQAALAGVSPTPALAELLTAMDADERADLWGRLPEEAREAVGRALAAAEREDIRRLASYPPGTAGAVMTSEYAVLSPGLSARDAIEALRGQAATKETILVAYVLSPERRLLGTVSLEDLVLSPATLSAAALMRPDPPSVGAEEPASHAARVVQHYDLPAVPVLDATGAMVGIVTADDAMDVAEAEATEDFEKSSGTGAGLVAEMGRASVPLLYSKRVGWLVALVFANILSGAGIAAFEETISANLALVFFLPLLIASAGNAGAQAATLTVRAMATGEVRMADWGRLISREALVALALGVTMAVAVAGIGIWRGGAEIALVVALTMVLVVLAGSLVGLSLPFLLDRLHLDPASASAPLVTSLADIAGVMIYFSIASVVLSS